jgi:hypothetical protein
MFREDDSECQSLQMETCTSKLIVDTTIKQEWNFELTSQQFMVYVNLSWPNSQGTILQISVGNGVQNP